MMLPPFLWFLTEYTMVVFLGLSAATLIVGALAITSLVLYLRNKPKWKLRVVRNAQTGQTEKVRVRASRDLTATMVFSSTLVLCLGGLILFNPLTLTSDHSVFLGSDRFERDGIDYTEEMRSYIMQKYGFTPSVVSWEQQTSTSGGNGLPFSSTTSFTGVKYLLSDGEREFFCFVPSADIPGSVAGDSYQKDQIVADLREHLSLVLGADVYDIDITYSGSSGGYRESLVHDYYDGQNVAGFLFGKDSSIFVSGFAAHVIDSDSGIYEETAGVIDCPEFRTSLYARAIDEIVEDASLAHRILTSMIFWESVDRYERVSNDASLQDQYYYEDFYDSSLSLKHWYPNFQGVIYLLSWDTFAVACDMKDLSEFEGFLYLHDRDDTITVQSLGSFDKPLSDLNEHGIENAWRKRVLTDVYSIGGDAVMVYLPMDHPAIQGIAQRDIAVVVILMNNGVQSYMVDPLILSGFGYEYSSQFGDYWVLSECTYPSAIGFFLIG